MKKIAKILLEQCPKNHRCPSMRACPVGALTQKSSISPPQIDTALCIGCGKCAMACPKHALYMSEEVCHEKDCRCSS